MIFATSFKKKGLKIAFGLIILGVLILFTPSFVSAILFSEGFEDCPLGNLNQCEDWSESGADNQWEVVDTNWYEGSQSILSPERELVAKSNNILDVSEMYFFQGDNGRLVFQWWLVKKDDETRFPTQKVALCNSTPSCVMLYVPVKTSADVKFVVVGVQEYTIANILTDELEDKWTQWEIEWYQDESNYLNFRGRWQEGDWTAWIQSTITELGFDTLNITRGPNDNVLKNTYMDWFRGWGVCALGNCQYCETYDTCMDAGCYWYYSIYACGIGQCYRCVEPFTPDPEDCGSFYKCQYCTTQETCELELNCEWVDRGLGVKCYMIEPEIPPEQVGWEAPTLEDCGALSGVEKWLCEIKNFIAGIFMPTQEALDKLYNTIGAFKDRFPFNYIGALNSFFDDIKDSLEEEKEIPITIFGQESNVDFSFWTTTAPIGGVSESFGNVVLDFTSLIIFLAWLVWLLSFIKRFF